MADPIWISVELTLAIHRRQLAEHGGAEGVRDQGLLESALDRPRHLFAYSDPKSDIPTLAAAYAFGISRNHAFIDGNKRASYVVCRTFLILNGFDLTASQQERCQTFVALATGELSEEALAKWLVENTARIAPP